jgi:cysteinyl-tRNA synthetase
VAQAIRVYNTLTRTKEEFHPFEEGHVRIYACGVTPYAEAHIGHARPALIWSVIRKYLEARGYRVTLVQNFTDVDDKIIDRANREGVHPLALARRFSEQYLESMRRLGIEAADFYPRVSDHIPQIIEMIQGLVEKGYAYVAGGDVFYDVTRFRDYGKLSGQRLDELMAGTRFEADERKRNPMDFALWKAAKPGEPAWDSPWGPGRPGWHIECSAMALHYLGNHVDFHGGGVDLVFPHHENEIAQSEAYTGRPPFVRFWVHNGLIKLGAEKMSKSLGNVVTVDELLERYPAPFLRFFLLNTHYRSPLEWSAQGLEDARRGWLRLTAAVVELRAFLRQHGIAPQRTAAEAAPQGGERPGEPGPLLRSALDVEALRPALDAEGTKYMEVVASAPGRFDEAMADDFNTALAIAVLFDLARATNGFRQRLARRGSVSAAEAALLAEAERVFAALGEELLGVIGDEEDVRAAGRTADDALVKALVELLLEVRQKARAAKDWATADAIRARLGELGIVVEDTAAGSRWRFREE